MDKVSLNTCYCILNFYPDNILVNILRTLNLFSLSFLTLKKKSFSIKVIPSVVKIILLSINFVRKFYYILFSELRIIIYSSIIPVTSVTNLYRDAEITHEPYNKQNSI